MTCHSAYYLKNDYQGMTEPWPKETCTENWVKFRHMVFEICEQMDRYIHKDSVITILCTPPGGGDVIMVTG